MDLTTIPAEVLQDELKRRERLKDKPVPLSKPDYSFVTQLAKDYIDDVITKTVDDDCEHYIFEEVINAVYGARVWEWIKKNS